MQNVIQLDAEYARLFQLDPSRYASCVEVSRRVRWDIDRDVIRGRAFDFRQKLMPDGLSGANRLGFLDESERIRLSQIQGRTYANMFALVERFIGAKMLELGREHSLGDQNALEALVRFTDDELKHQALFRRIEGMVAAGMPEGYRFGRRTNDVAWLVLGKSTWAVLALTTMIELLTQAHYRESIAPDPTLSELYKDVFFFHWREESQHAILDELEWRRTDAQLTRRERDEAVDDFIALLGTLAALLREQAKSDCAYFLRTSARTLSGEEAARVEAVMLRAYRWQFVLSGVDEEHFADTLAGMVTDQQAARIAASLVPLVETQA